VLYNLPAITTGYASLSKTGGTQPSQTYNTPPSNQASSQGYQGPLTVADALTDALNPATTRTDGTNADIIYYVQNADGTYRQIATSSSNSASVNIVSTIKTIWMQVKIPSGQAFYPALDKMAGSYSRMGLATWATPDLSNLYSAVFPIDVTNLGTLGTGLTTPQITIPIQLYTQSSTSNISSNGCTSTCGAGDYITNTNHTGVGAGTVQNIEPLTLNFATPATGISLFNFKMALNDTTTTDINTGQSYCAVPYGATTQNWSFAGTNVQQIIGASTVTYQFNIATDQTIRTGDMITVPLVGQNWVSFNCYIYTSLPSTNNGITFTPSWTWLDMQGATHVITGHTFKVVA